MSVVETSLTPSVGELNTPRVPVADLMKAGIPVDPRQYGRGGLLGDFLQVLKHLARKGDSGGLKTRPLTNAELYGGVQADPAEVQKLFNQREAERANQLAEEVRAAKESHERKLDQAAIELGVLTKNPVYLNSPPAKQQESQDSLYRKYGLTPQEVATHQALRLNNPDFQLRLHQASESAKAKTHQIVKNHLIPLKGIDGKVNSNHPIYQALEQQFGPQTVKDVVGKLSPPPKEPDWAAVHAHIVNNDHHGAWKLIGSPQGMGKDELEKLVDSRVQNKNSGAQILKNAEVRSRFRKEAAQHLKNGVPPDELKRHFRYESHVDDILAERAAKAQKSIDPHKKERDRIRRAEHLVKEAKFKTKGTKPVKQFLEEFNAAQRQLKAQGKPAEPEYSPTTIDYADTHEKQKVGAAIKRRAELSNKFVDQGWNGLTTDEQKGVFDSYLSARKLQDPTKPPLSVQDWIAKDHPRLAGHSKPQVHQDSITGLENALKAKQARATPPKAYLDLHEYKKRLSERIEQGETPDSAHNYLNSRFDLDPVVQNPNNKTLDLYRKFETGGVHDSFKDFLSGSSGDRQKHLRANPLLVGLAHQSEEFDQLTSFLKGKGINPEAFKKDLVADMHQGLSHPKVTIPKGAQPLLDALAAHDGYSNPTKSPDQREKLRLYFNSKLSEFKKLSPQEQKDAAAFHFSDPNHTQRGYIDDPALQHPNGDKNPLNWTELPAPTQPPTPTNVPAPTTQPTTPAVPSQPPAPTTTPTVSPPPPQVQPSPTTAPVPPTSTSSAQVVPKIVQPPQSASPAPIQPSPTKETSPSAWGLTGSPTLPPKIDKPAVVRQSTLKPLPAKQSVARSGVPPKKETSWGLKELSPPSGSPESWGLGEKTPVPNPTMGGDLFTKALELGAKVHAGLNHLSDHIYKKPKRQRAAADQSRILTDKVKGFNEPLTEFHKLPEEVKTAVNNELRRKVKKKVADLPHSTVGDKRDVIHFKPVKESEIESMMTGLHGSQPSAPQTATTPASAPTEPPKPETKT